MIRATGVIDGKELTVAYKDGEYLFNSIKDPVLEDEFKAVLSERHPVGGVFYPEKTDDPLNILNTLENFFFYKAVKAEVFDEDIQEMPAENGGVH